MRSSFFTPLMLLAALFIWVSLPVSAEAASPGWVLHKVRRGDTLGRIAKRYKTTTTKIRKLNGLTRRSAILPGQKLRVKARAQKTKKPTKRQRAAARKAAARDRKKARSKEAHAKKAKSKKARSSAEKSKRRKGKAKKSGKAGHAGWVTHKVKRGDYLWGIADRYDVTIKTIVRLNRLGRRPKIRPGMTLRIKEGSRQKLLGGVTLPKNGPGYRAIRPARSWGTPGTVRLIREVYEEVAELHPGTVPGLVADLSKEGGGHLRPHRSHQRGVDVDVSYFKKGNKKTRGLEVMTAETFDLKKNWDLIRAFINTGHVSVIFMDHTLQGLLYRYLKRKGYDDATLAMVMQYPRARSERRGVLRHHPGHHHHLHVRFTCESANDPCQRPAIAKVPALGGERVVAVVRNDRPRSDIPVAVLEPAPVRVVEPIVREAGPSVSARVETRPAPTNLRRDAQKNRKASSRAIEDGSREVPRQASSDAFAAITGLRGPQQSGDAYSRLEFDRAGAPQPAPAVPMRVGPRAAEQPARVPRFGCVGQL